MDTANVALASAPVSSTVTVGTLVDDSPRPRTFEVPAGAKAYLEEVLAKLGKKAARMGLPPFELTWGEPYLGTIIVLTDNGYADMPAQHVERDCVLCSVTVSGLQSVKFGGWTFAAALDHQDGGNILRNIGDEPVPEKYRTADAHCEHCRSARRRKDTYVLRHESGTYRQVGSSCIKDFLGGHSPDGLLAKAEMIKELCATMGDQGGLYGHAHPMHHTHQFLAQAFACARRGGYVSRKQVEIQGGGITTAHEVELNLLAETLRPKDFVVSLVDDCDTQKATDAIAWAASLSDEVTRGSEFLHNIRLIARSEYFEARHSGFAAAIVVAFDKELVRRFERETRKPSAHQGKIGDKLVVKVLVKNCVELLGEWGTSRLYILVDGSGNVFKTSTTSKDFYPETGKEYNVVGTVKAHNEYKGTMQTSLTRCVLVADDFVLKTSKPRKAKAKTAQVHGPSCDCADCWDAAFRGPHGPKCMCTSCHSS